MATILLAEDRAAERERLREALQQRGHVVETARNGFEALDAFAATEPDVVILDLFMPKMNGFDALLHLRRLFPDARVIAVTDRSTIGEDALHEAVELGADRVMAKPLDADPLLETIRELLAA